ncbi:tetratricopeptide repeat protein [Flavobacterium urocaniciphilum]|uniref:Tetratricopeptide repeat-containing protein n=1 Tax=Flavobacterium urocaniciphilum TaxID=1299341 RepID=A0A1H8YS77_9FLAO|nr:tetratricopeptide repeat protein [Flavobacterium urocaniciphilum]SEP55084.1 Tetratricopeptide repeat-containing protein [Flavobacterium urocaniciphilum]
MKKLITLLLFTTLSFAQKDGYWDKERAFTKEIKLSSGNRTLVKIDDLPEGASEFVFRISLIDENGKITTSLASILKAIPDPTGISQGTAGAITLTNSLSGDDTCLYGIYTSEKAGAQFLKDGKLETACYFIKEPVNKDSKVISIKNTKCFENAPNIWFAFENKNWVMSTKIVLEVVSWIDYNASRGWNATTKKEVLSLIDNSSILKAPISKEKFQGAFLEGFTAKYKYSEFKQMLPIEKNRVVEVLSEESLKKSGQLDKYLNYFREDIRMLSFSNRDDEAIKKYITQVFDKKWATDKDYDLLGNLYLKTKQFQKAEEYINKAISLNKNEIGYQLHLANVYLYTDKVSEAKDIHKKYKNQNIDANTSWVQATKSNFDNMKKVGLPTDNFKKILRILE